MRCGRTILTLRGFTLLELLLALAVAGLLAALLFPVFFGARRKAAPVTCVSNLRQLGQALELYRQDWEQYAPQGWQDTRDNLETTMSDPLAAYIKNESLYRCPEANHPAYIFRASFDVGMDNARGAGDDLNGRSQFRLFELDAASVIAYCQHRLVFDAHGGQTGFYLTLREDHSVKRVDARRLTAWTYHNGKWLPPNAPQPANATWPQIDVFPDEPFPLPFINQP